MTFMDSCERCVYWKAEAENNISILKGNKRYCDVYKDFTKPNHTCALFKEERFEATADSIQTEEIELNTELSIEESEPVDQGSKQK